MFGPGSTTTQILDSLNRGSQTAVDVAEAHLNAITRHDKSVGAFLNVDADSVLARAADIDKRRATGESLGMLAGLPVAVKDLVCTKDQTTSCASRMLENFVPPYDAHVIERLRDEDAVLIGKVNMDEFAMGSSTESSAFKLTRNPWNPDHTPGGSSGGSAAAVAAGMAPLSIGSDTGGSIRQPASFCGVVGLKPTYGRVSRYGLVAFASSLDQIGPLANDVAGTALLLEVLAGHDKRDSTCVDRPVPEYAKSVNEPLNGLRIGVLDEIPSEGLDPDVKASFDSSIEAYKSMGAIVSDVSLPHTKYCVATYYLIACSEASSNLARYDGVHYGRRADKYENMIDMYAASRGEGFGDEVKRRIMLGTYALSAGYYEAYYAKALKVRRLIRQDFDAAFGGVDVVAMPVFPTPAFKIGELVDDPLQMYLSDIFTISANLAGLPAVSVPAGMSSGGLPIGLQLLAPAFEEERLLRAARMFESATDWHTRRAPIVAGA
jgi:aspartyl-tRNA(Asn)/glutamyl-tRNA(Gln) amidotransferase subunit A